MKGFPGGSHNKESTFSARDTGSIPGLGRPLERGMATHSSILAWRIPWTERLAGYSPLRCKEPNVIEWLTLSPFFFFSVTIRLCTPPGLARWLNVKNLPPSAGDTGDMSSIPGLGWSPGNEMATHSSILALKIPWTEEPDRLQSMGFQRLRCYWTQRYTHTIWDSIPCKGT